MQQPGSNPDIPEEADLIFEEVWDTAEPGKKKKLAYLELHNGRRLVVFPYRGWDPPIGELRRCVLYVLQNAAAGAPVGGIPESEKVEAGGEISFTSVADGQGTLPELPPELAAVVRGLADQLNAVVLGLDELVGQASGGDSEDSDP